MGPWSLSSCSTTSPAWLSSRRGQSQQPGCRKPLRSSLCPGHLLSALCPLRSTGHTGRSLATTCASGCPCRHSAEAPGSLKGWRTQSCVTGIASGHSTSTCNPPLKRGWLSRWNEYRDEPADRTLGHVIALILQTIVPRSCPSSSLPLFFFFFFFWFHSIILSITPTSQFVATCFHNYISEALILCGFKLLPACVPSLHAEHRSGS